MIVIIGGTGVIGSAFARWCAERNLPHLALDCSNYNAHVGTPCTLLVNANGNSFKPLANQAPLDDFEQTVQSVRRSLVDFAPDLYVHLSSCDVYGDCSSLERSREDQMPDVATQSTYGFHKSLAESCVRHGAPNWLIFRLGGVVGPGLRKNAIFDILSGGPLWLAPESRLQFLHTDSLAKIAMDLADRGLSGEIFNLCGKGTVQLKEIIDELGREVSAKPDAPSVIYNVSIEKISRFTDIPESAESVSRFIGEQVAPGR